MDQASFNSRLRLEVKQFVNPKRRESAAFLIWYLHNFFRIDEQEAIDSVCDSENDKGIDGIWADDEYQEIHLFQSKFSPYDNRDQGDNDLRNFVGARQWFNSEETVNDLLASTASAELKSLIERLRLPDKISSGYAVYLNFVTNKKFDVNATEFLNVNKSILDGHDMTSIFDRYTYIAKEEIQTTPKTLLLRNPSRIEYDLPEITVRVLPVQVKELLKLDGIQDLTLFHKNVRYGLGRTRVYKEIKKTLSNSSEHNNFFLYHNGITIVCDTLDITPTQITIQNYSVINGCQSMLAFYANRDKVTDNIYVLSKIIQLKPNLPLVDSITYYANNQAAVRARDLKSNDRIQVELQNEFFKLFKKTVLYTIKQGEPQEGYSQVIDNQFAAQLIEAFYLRSPQTTHLKTRLFSERYLTVFSRHISATKIYLPFIIHTVIEEKIDQISSEQIRDYGLAKFFLLYTIREILENDNLGKEILDNPEKYILGDRLEEFKKSIEKLFALVALDVNAAIDDHTSKNDGFFDYKNLFKNADFVSAICGIIATNHKKSLIRHPEDSFENIFKTFKKVPS